MSRWLLVRETHTDIRAKTSRRNGRGSGGYPVGYLVSRLVIGIVEAPSRTAAEALHPCDRALSVASLECGDRVGWLRMPVGVVVEERVHYEGATRAIDRLRQATVRAADVSLGRVAA